MSALRPPLAFNLVLIGCGKMGGALVKGWREALPSLGITIIDPQAEPISGTLLLRDLQSAAAYIKGADIVVLAVKPQNIQDICCDLKTYLDPQTLVFSIAAGQTLANLSHFLGASCPLVRAMPNTPALIGQGACVAVSNSVANKHQREIVEQLMRVSGLFEWIEDENLMDAVTALSGSGPAYVYYMIEVLSRAGEKIGLTTDLAEKLARQTVIGSAALAAHDSSTPASVLRENVTSPGGTTQAALDVLMNGEFDDIIEKALKAAVKRGQDLRR